MGTISSSRRWRRAPWPRSFAKISWRATRSKTGLLAVDDTLVALQTLGAAVRRLWGKPLVGVTGSTGKTTTKEAIAHVLSSRFRVLKSEGNFNNHFGLPLMLLKIEPEHEAAVIEMGMSHRGEIAALAKIAQPEIGVVTNVAPVHLEFFKSVAEIARAKYELIESLPAGGTAILNADDEYVSQFGRDFQRQSRAATAFNPTADVRAENIESRGAAGFSVRCRGRRPPRARDPALVGTHNIYNALAAVAVGMERGLSLAEAAGALATLAPADKRGAVVQLGNITVINDCYNSNPTALDAMVDTLAAMPAKRRIVVAGEMLELGPSGEELHRRSGQHMAKKGIDILVGVRGLAQADGRGRAGRPECRQNSWPRPKKPASGWRAKRREGDVVLLKASRGVKLERALEAVVSRQSSVVSKSKTADDVLTTGSDD